MNDPYETTATQLERLLGRALNSFDLPDATIERLDSALAHASSLHSSHHSAALHRTTYQHAYLLSDGSSLVLWELVHNTGRDGAEQHELYTEESEVRLAASRLPAGFPGFAGSSGTNPDAAPADEFDADLELLTSLLAAPPAPLPRMYVPDDSADHARRVLRRAENADGPGEETARLLRAAFAHHITQVFGRQCQVEGKGAGFTLYEHAFLLLDGTETSLWEVEHTATPDGRHMCEVYAAEHIAREAMELRAQVR
ncbi:hypothetical protein HRW23_14285 [Streptomyces lunaelactis]|uniref:DUF6227 family protein n=1 Tax=Streptomyces lunaelactis TaxID=1535768 RepID=UPI0015851D25|nr:DUF6227 family protein [Streptomyces lunaelactis]NUK02133.1 hypothetical protein [Streptomyces lunaelactis]NUK07429.1 hypothetical protein [Streptomyces lunaelactis]NUK16986.1 hypothetical protein [Streptomyces lunaelactis]NUK35034.1 hypothetical protein [Streptomyces lunaelactis]NUK42611.1 hypothetical protein [Streptomyces lunaelactis]